MHAFTLIELLVVISIILLLIAILLPVLKSARLAAQAVASVSNARQIQTALTVYANDYSESLPFFQDIEGNRWGGLLTTHGYIDTPRLFWSAGRDTSFIDDTDWRNMREDASETYWAYTGYGVNGFGAMPKEDWYGTDGRGSGTSGYSDPPGAALGPVRLYDVDPQPDKLLTVGESWRPYYRSLGIDGRHVIKDKSRLFTYNRRAVAAYLDGHATSNDSMEIGWQATGPYSGSWEPSESYVLRREPWFDQRFRGDTW